MKNNNIENLVSIVFDTFGILTTPKEVMKLTIGSCEEWDSLGNFNLLLAIEDFYKIKFSLLEFENLDSMEKIYQALEERLS
jgi:acyl carrier protein